MTGVGRRHTLEELFEGARSQIERYEPVAALEAVRAGAVLIDIRAGDDRARDGIIPGSLHIPRTVLEWRTDPGSDWHNPGLGSLDEQVILLCDHGYSSVLAAATLVQLGFTRAGDVIGGYAAWQEAGLPTRSCHPRSRRPGEPTGMNPPEH